jgi:hypothetical protein
VQAASPASSAVRFATFNASLNGVRGVAAPIGFAHRYTPNTNTGLASGLDLDKNGSVGGGNDAYGSAASAGSSA